MPNFHRRWRAGFKSAVIKPAMSSSSAFKPWTIRSSGNTAKEKHFIIVSKDEGFVDRWLLKPEGVRVVWIRKGDCSNRSLLTWLEMLWPDVLKRLEQGEQLIELRA